LKYYRQGVSEISFSREEFAEAAKDLKIDLPKNLGDILYTFRYRSELPETIAAKANTGYEWIIRPAGRGKYLFVQTVQAKIEPSKSLAKTKLPDSTPGIIEMYALSDEQALLAKIRYNRLIDIFTGLTCYSLQNHLRSSVTGMGQIETDEIYVGINKQGVHYVLPIQAKGGNDRLGVIQIEQDIALCAAKFPNLLCLPIAAQFVSSGVIALFQLEDTEEGIKISAEKHYQLVPSEDLTDVELSSYRHRLD
jgi:hypothetical protein